MRQLVRSLILAAAYLFVMDARPVATQELGVFVQRGSSDHAELQKPWGVGAFALFRLNESWQARLSLSRYSQETAKDGTVCIVYEQRIGCQPEAVENSASLGSLRVSSIRSFTLVEGVSVGLGGGFSVNSVTATSLGESGRRAELYSPKTAQVGWLALGSAGISPIPSVPLRLVGTVTGHWINFNSCAPLEVIYDPYCGITLFRELEVGITYTF